MFLFIVQLLRAYQMVLNETETWVVLLKHSQQDSSST